jgi:uncharacterized protein involved in outer membrane biogenesis
MKKPVKILVWSLAGLAALAVVSIFVVLLFIDKIVKTAVEAGGSAAAGVAVTLSAADVSLGSSRLELEGFAIQNPPKFRIEPFVRFGHASAAWDQNSIFSDVIVIDELTIDDVVINLEHSDGKTNFGSILDHMGARKTHETPAPADPNAKKRTLLVKHILVTNVKAAVHVPGLAENSAGVTVAKIELKDFKSDGSTTEIVAALTGTLVDALMTATLDAGSANLPKEISAGLERQVDALKSQAQGVLEQVKGMQDIFKKLK